MGVDGGAGVERTGERREGREGDGGRGRERGGRGGGCRVEKRREGNAATPSTSHPPPPPRLSHLTERCSAMSPLHT